MSTARRAWAWIQSHPLVADASLAAVLLAAAIVSSNVELDNLRPGDPALATAR